jgi:spore coat polysaccharide biosynthesis predicted glycosyltransferase SpsG
MLDKDCEIVFVGDTTELPWLSEKVLKFGLLQSFRTGFEFWGDRSEYILILDSYVIPKEDLFITKSDWKGVIAFVDEDTPNYEADLYIGALISSAWVKMNEIPEKNLLKGFEFLPIRKSLHEIKKALSLNTIASGKVEISKIKTIIVVGGGADANDFCKHIAKILLQIEFPFRALLFTNSIFPADERFSFLEIGSALDTSLPEADVIFTTSGTSVWEFLYLGIPMGFAQAAQNQNRNYQILSTIEGCTEIGFFDQVSGWHLSSEKILSTIKDSQYRRIEMVDIDGFGVSRIFEEMKKRFRF